MAEYQQYEEYKDSGVEWLGELPKHWRVWKLNHFAPIITCGVASTPEYVDEGVVFLSAQNVKYGKVDLSKGHKFISQKSHMELTKNRIPKKNDILLSRVGTVGEACIVDVGFEFSIFVSLTHLRLNNSVCRNDFFVYLCSSKYVKSLHQAVTLVGGGVGNLNVNDLREYKLPLPTTNEQAQIANFLDHETAQIDTLIENQQTLIKLLKEKRQAVISHAVTKGLNPDAPMKDSGVEWLGDVPEHWIVMQFRRITSLSQGLQIPQSERLHEPSKNNVEYITIKSIHAGDTLEHREYINKPSLRVQCDYDDVLLARTGATGEVITGVKGAFHNNFFKIDYSEKITKSFLVNMLKVQELRSHLLMLAGTTTIPDLNHGAFLSTAIALPSLDEQEEVCLEISRLSEKYTLLLEVALKQVKLLQERRTALISAAVTGKIDVRDWQAPVIEAF
jgi:type I restriction enzyme S subunit